MSASAPIVTIFGGSGFVGRYITQRLAREGWRIRVAVRRPNEAQFLKPYGDVGQVAPVQANIRDDASVARAVAGADAVVNCVGVLAELGRQSFSAVQEEGAARIAHAAADAGVSRLVHISAIGANSESPSAYARTKAEGERLLREAFPDAIVLRPSIIFGPEDQFFNRFAAMARLSPVLPIVGGATKFQPVYVDDVARAAVAAVTGAAQDGATYELGGPDVRSFRELMELMLRVVRRRRLLLDLPIPVAKLQARLLGLTALVGIQPPLTLDQVRLLAVDNVVGPGSKTFADLAIAPTAAEAVLESYLYAYRPYGQYAEITEDA